MPVLAEHSARYGGHGLALLRALAEHHAATFTVDQARAAARALGIADSYLPLLQHRLQRAGFVARLKRGVYAFACAIPHAPGVHPFSVAMALVVPCAIGGWAALSHHGLTEQIPDVVTLLTPKHVVTPAMRGVARTAPSVWEVSGQRYEIASTIPANFFGHEGTRVPASQDSMNRVLRNAQLIQQFTASGSVYEMRIKPREDPQTPSGFAWTSRHGPPLKLGSGTLLRVQVAVSEKRPIEMVIPTVRRWIGI